MILYVLGRSELMNQVAERYIVDHDGNRIAVILSIEEYERLLEQLEEQDEIRAYDEAIDSGDEEVALEDVIAEFESRP
jgi:PHD/YefM family antitoxin component YafN of YafNO toxin-antitoxin module